MRARLWLIAAAVLSLGLSLSALFASAGRTELVADLSEHLVAISTGFTGTNVLLFGTIAGEGDVVVTVRGPEHRAVVRRKGRNAGIWVNEAEMTFDNVPSYYAIAESRPVAEFVPERLGDRHQIGLDNLKMPSSPSADPAEVASFRQGLIRNKQRAGLYVTKPIRIVFLGERLFRADMYFPANAPIGTYSVQALLVRDGEVVSAQITPLIVSKVGFEAGVFDVAHQHAFLYGILAILIAIVAGWVANLMFRKD
jgi:uncharacterized protein (TIGR02186 family)